jgi:hypothetical protein
MLKRSFIITLFFLMTTHAVSAMELAPGNLGRKPSLKDSILAGDGKVSGTNQLTQDKPGGMPRETIMTDFDDVAEKEAAKATTKKLCAIVWWCDYPGGPIRPVSPEPKDQRCSLKKSADNFFFGSSGGH